jgi:CRAL/TRIO, N-terminal domain
MATTKVLLNFPWSKGSKDSSDVIKPSNEKLNICDSFLKVAKKELREDKTTREQALEQMRDWLKKNYDVENVRTDDSFLLRFLRNKKFSVPMAQQQLLKYLNMRKVMGHLSFNLDFLSPGVRDLINNGYIMVSPIRDKLGRRTVLYFASKFWKLLSTFDSINFFVSSSQMA